MRGWLLALAITTGGALQGAEPAGVQFNRDIRGILSDKCFACHGPDAGKRAAELRLDIAEEATRDLGGRAAIVPGNLDESEVWQRIISTDPSERMPPPKANAQLTPAQVELLGRWIKEGAKYERHWAFVPPQRPATPPVTNAAWPRNGLDAFILAKLEAVGLAPSAEAARETLIRRVTLDLTGLPPTVAEIDDFLADESPDAYERVVDRLLASPRYGERMVLEWLDAARYADSNGYQTDGTRAMWPWRDWAIGALNANMPFDELTAKQIAGDLLPEPTLADKLATGFHRNHMLNGEGGRIAEESRVDYVVDRVETTATVWLGLTLGCCRCHDHKYDPFSQKEFYQLYAFWNSINETGGVDRRSGTAAPTIELPTPEQTAAINDKTAALAAAEAALKAKIDELTPKQAEWEKTVDVATQPEPIQAILKIAEADRNAEQKKQLTDHYLASHPEKQALQKQVDDAKNGLNGAKNAVLITMVMEERPEPRETFLLKRGQYDQYGDKVERGVPALLGPLPEGAPMNRLGLAKWLTSPANPLTARVTVNRVWQMFFGVGLVKTTEDFGVQGELPSHPELLDWLAVEFANGWDVKRLHRLIVTSATYRQSSHVSPALLERDPENRLLGRGPRFRWNSQVLRDQALALAGLLVEKQGGPPVRPYQPAGIWEDFSFGRIVYQQDHGENLYRRSLYTFWRRSVGPTSMFDASTRQVCTVKLPRTNTPLHALILMNDPAFVEAARVLGERILRDGGATPADRITWAFRRVTGRRPSAAELAIVTQSHARVLQHFQQDKAAAEKLVAAGESPRPTDLDPAEHAAATAVANLLLNLDEVLNKE